MIVFQGSGEEVSVFVFDIKNNSDTQFEVAKTAVKRLKTLRHPSILTYLDSLETDKMLYLVTEYIEPLHTHLETSCSNEGTAKELYLAWGIFQITRALSFVNNDCNMRHNNVCLWSVFVNCAGEWKLGGVEYMAGTADGTGLPIKVLPSLDKYDPPEKADLNRQKTITKCSTDMWGLGCLIWEVFNGPLPKQSSLKHIESIPKSLSGAYCEMVGANPNTRPNPADLITRCRKNGGYFKNELVDSLLFLEESQIKDKNEKSRFLNNLTNQLDRFPQHICKHKILPQLITAFEYGDAGAAVLAPMFKLGRLLDDAEYQKKIVPCVVKLFASNDRATRSRLLQQLEHFIDHLQASTVNEQIFPQIANGFLDTNPTIREQTVKSIIHLSPKLNYNNLNLEVLRHFARLQAKDDQSGIRTNTTVCLGKIAQHLHPQIRQKVLISAFIRAMRDPFPPARSAGVLALAATQQYFLLSEVARRILPALCHLTVDPEKTVRDNAFRTIKGFLGKLEKVSEEPTLRESMEADVHAATPSLSNAAATWAGWAVTAVTAKFYRSQSDTPKSQHPPHRILTKPASLEQPSSSSLSTTTSSVTSMTSLEQEANKGGVTDGGQDSVSDYDCDNWDAASDNWGDMEEMAAGQGESEAEGEVRGTDGWDTEEWGSLEPQPEQVTGSDSWATGDFTLPNSRSSPNIGRIGEEFTSATSLRRSGESAFSSEGISTIVEEDKSKLSKEERRQQRQKELEARRAQRLSAGPMKLATKKI
ncbi:N-terminal kinase-like protein [Nilaparvata lugens]|uniref:N-terminal kinase-like protein n=1 Tax=Nilaparvata lugens TaxID=108931 RepID=UPI00193E00A3|nr:N-terminal kinase-like protein [Nilaparvata lugens]